ncbi:MAG: phosphopantetheine-binding protein, partial [Cyanobacteria bacterium J06573_2]
NILSNNLSISATIDVAIKELPPKSKLVTLWEQAFAIQPIGIQDDFFDLGGNSLMATSMIAEIENLFDKKFNQAIFFQAPTIQQLAELVSQEEIVSESIVKINSHGSKTPLFIISNTSFLYQEMIEHLDAEQPIYIIKEELTKASEMAFACLKQIKSIQLNGPYYLMGHSYEGLVTYEIACQLYKLNEEVAFLGMLDSAIPEVENRARNKTSFYKRYRRLKTVFKLSWKDIINFFKERIDYKLSKKFYPLLSTLDTLINEHELKYYPGKITVFSALYEFYRIEDVNLGWDKWVSGGIEIHEIPGTHRSMLLRPDNAKLLAQKINACLSK